MVDGRVDIGVELFEACGRLAVVTGTLAVPSEFPELYTRDQLAAVVCTQHKVLVDLRAELESLSRSVLVGEV